MAIAISTGYGDAPISWAIEIPIGHKRAAAAVFDINCVKPHDKQNILPVPDSPEMTLRIHEGHAGPAPRLVYSSKVLSGIFMENGMLTADFSTRSTARFRFVTDKPSVVLGASSFSAAYDGNSVSGRLEGSGSVSLLPVESSVTIHSSTLPFKSVKVTSEGLEVTLVSNGARHNTIVYSDGNGYRTMAVPGFEGEKTVIIK